MRLQNVYESYRDRVDFWWVYIREAHPTGSRRPAKHVEIAQPTTLDRRTEVAEGCTAALNLKIPQLIDDMDDTVSRAYAAWPDRLYILSPDGKVAYQGGRGPWGFKTDEMEARLKALLEAQSSTSR